MPVVSSLKMLFYTFPFTQNSGWHLDPCHREGEQPLTGWNHEREAGRCQGASTSVDGKEA